MCGIAGFIDSKNTKENALKNIQLMLKAIQHRGPDNSSVWQSENVTLGHNRLSIIDLHETANQPFEYLDVVIVFNGEVYNYLELRNELQKKGWQFRTNGDTEVICAAYKEWGEQCVTHFVGMWAFALWDKTTSKLFCSRDRFGIKPFYYYNTASGFYFASEYKAFKALDFFNSEINNEQIKRLIAINIVCYKSETFYKHLHQLLPAHNLVLSNGKVSIYSYWDVNLNQCNTTTFEEKKATFQQLFSDSIKLHSRSDVKNGICLSGGLDSSAIASAYSTVFPESEIQSFSIFFEGAGKVDERPFIREVVKKYPNIKPYYLSPSHNDVKDTFERAAFSADAPMIESSFISQNLLMKLAASQGVKVVLDGQGSDEYLGGYLHSFYRIIGSKIKSGSLFSAISLLQNLAQREQFSTKKNLNFFLKSFVAAFKNEEEIYRLESLKTKAITGTVNIELETKTGNKFNNFLYHLIFTTTLQTILHNEDRNSMAYSIESRVPFLDHRLVEFAFSLQTEDRISPQAETKYLLREGLKDILPTAVYERKDKKGFVTAGEAEWLNGPLRFLLEDNFDALEILNSANAKHLIDEYKSGNYSNSKLVWKLANINYWLKNLA
ncbi:MAG TPA: asparagine synthase (glutamine-hydrolyzing) [Chitinophagales bacterium]|nr:asparagine synthase (glutamine-hydrolyzing) [Chitinophagales bacterium]HRP40204.1 asparagine synthase (glutamine-hydrolyzing) [Chitinophagales bacterium]